MPDLVLIWVAALGYGLLAGWGSSGPWLFGGISILGLLGVLADIWLSAGGARLGGSSLWGILGGLALGIVGLVFGGPLGALGGFLVGVFLVELARRKDAGAAARALLGTAVGYAASFPVKLLMALLMIGLWAIWVVAR
jgi:uncharacterized protein YqgC (DUF456 family)